jgi:hypothetical protein
MTVYFKNGRTLDCDYAWKDGNTVFVVVHGKKFAVGYDQGKIDVGKSFRNGEISPFIRQQTKHRTPEKPATKEAKREYEYSSPVKYKYGSGWSGPGVHRRIEDKGSRQSAEEPEPNKSEQQRGYYGKVRSSAPSQGSYKNPGGPTGTSKYKKDVKRYNDEVRRHNANVRRENDRRRREYDRKVKEYDGKVKEYEKKRQETEKQNAEVKKHNDRIKRKRYNAAKRKADERYYKKGKSTTRDSGKIPYLSHDGYSEMMNR